MNPIGLTTHNPLCPFVLCLSFLSLFFYASMAFCCHSSKLVALIKVLIIYMLYDDLALLSLYH